MVQLVDELRDADPQLLVRIGEEALRIKQLPSEALKAQSVKEAYTKLERRMNEAVVSGKLSSRAVDAWHDLRAQAEEALRDGSLLEKARYADKSWRARRDANFQQAIAMLTRELRDKAPEVVRRILDEARRISSISDEQTKLVEIGKAYDRLDRRISGLADQLSPGALAMWQDFRAEVERATRDQAVTPLARLAYKTYLNEVLALVEDEEQRLGSNPGNNQLSRELTEALRGLELRASLSGKLGISREMLMEIVPGLTLSKAQELAPFINQAMDEADMTTPRQRAAFIAQIAHETGGFRTFREYGGEKYFLQRYEPVFKKSGALTAAEQRRARIAKDLGNTMPGDGPRFRGRGALQLTGRANYTRASHDLFGDDRLVRHPETVEQPNVAFRTAVWFWRQRKLNDVAARGDFRLVTRRINGGTNGWDDRLRYYTRALGVLGAGAP